MVRDATGGVELPVTIELHFDGSFEARINHLWDTMEESGISSGARGFFRRPHVTLGLVETLDVPIPAEDLRDIALRYGRVALVFGSFGSFGSDEGVAFLSPVPTGTLLALNGDAVELLHRHSGTLRQWYLPGTWTPHCTVATGVLEDQLGALFLALRAFKLPTVAMVSSIAVVEYPGSEVVVSASSPI